MSGELAFEDPQEDPKEEFLKVEVAKIRIIYDIPMSDESKFFSHDELEEFKEKRLKPSFVNAQNEILTRFGEKFEVSSIEVKNGSIWVEFSLFLMILAKNPIAHGVLSSILAGIAVNAFYSPSLKKEHKQLMHKISKILESHTKNIAGQNFEIEKNYFPIYDPKFDDYKQVEFTFHSKRLERLYDDVQKAIQDYHSRIGK